MDKFKHQLNCALPPRPSENKKRSNIGLGKKKNYTPVSWENYFTKCQEVSINEEAFTVYSVGESGPVILMLHGGGHSALSWASLAQLLVTMSQCQCIAPDLRCHGSSKSSHQNLSLESMSTDVSNIINQLFNDQVPPIVLIGHSMGGALAIDIANQEKLPTLVGLIVIDVVEGSAMDALPSMQSFLRSRPESFPSLEQAIEWSVKSRQIQNAESARVSVPGQLKKSSITSSSFKDQQNSNELSAISESSEIIQSTSASATASTSDSSSTSSHVYTWQIDLKETEPFWKEWFTNLTEKFLTSEVPKLLLLAGVDRLDKQMTIAQMQGKFQMVIFDNTGHMLHEDQPERVSSTIAQFLKRQRLAEAVES